MLLFSAVKVSFRVALEEKTIKKALISLLGSISAAMSSPVNYSALLSRKAFGNQALSSMF